MIHIKIPSIPPSSNHAYATIRGTSKRVLTTEGRSYKTLTTAHIAQKYPIALKFFKPNTPYLLLVRFWFSQITNSGYPKKADNLYKKLDVSNRLKLLEDALKDAGGVDDSQNMTIILQKFKSEDERTEIWVWELEAEKTPFDEAFNSI